MIVILMGVSGSGKTTIGTVLAERTGAVFADADDYHPAANKAKMAAGNPLNDDDRQPWLETLNRLMRGWAGEGRAGVLACSALKEKYRATLAAGLADVHFVLLDGSRELIGQRLAVRHHEFMNSALLDSQFATLEPPSDADAFIIVNDQPPAAIADRILAHVSSSGRTSA
jgi:gluconokinase